MIRVLSSLIFSMTVNMVVAQTTVLTGKIKDFDAAKTHATVMDMADLEQEIEVPIQVSSDGTFSIGNSITRPSTYYLFFDNPHAGFMFYVEPGMKADMQIAFVKEG